MVKQKASWNPLAFRPAQVTVIASAIYLALIAVLLWAHLSVPSAPANPEPADGVNLPQAWQDLQYISEEHHPLDSRRNEKVRAYLVRRLEQIIQQNGKGPDEAVLFGDDRSNATFTNGASGSWVCYGESSSILLYIRGKHDPEGAWWTDLGEGQAYAGRAGVLVNAHYDSVSSGYGATDDGVGVATVLQLVSHFTTPSHQPDRGIVALLNNGEENGLYGAHNYLRHPLSRFTHTFLNLEGAGAGGKSTLFRSTDAEVTRFYSQSPYPFGSVIGSDGFKRGFIRSATDYSVFVDKLGMRGLDVAFFSPRARYHTNQDDVRNTSPDSLWHMLSSSLSTMQALTSYSGDEFEGSASETGKLQLGRGHRVVYFDIFGRTLAVLPLSALFALSVTLLTAGPVLLILLEILVARSGKWYPFSRKSYLHSPDDDDAVRLGGLRGFVRFPFAFVVSTAAVVALAFLLVKVNPYVIYSSEWTVWGMMLCAWFSVAWFLLAGADRIRPSALQRMFCILWIYALSWVALVVATVGEKPLGLGSGYFVVIYNAAAFFALLVSYLELFALPTKTQYVEHVSGAMTEDGGRSTRPGSRSSRTLLSQSREQRDVPQEADEEEATESTSLLRGRHRLSQGTFTGVGKRRRQQEEEEEEDVLNATDDPFLTRVYGDEQPWSSKLPQWAWVIQFIILAPINIIITGQIALLLTTAMHQTVADGNPALPIYLVVAVFTVIFMLPLTPFLHRFAYQVPTILFIVFIGSLIYNILAFPFSRDARLKHFFVQQIDLDTGVNHVGLAGLDGFVQDIINQLPSSASTKVDCGDIPWAARAGLTSCAWQGLPPNVVADDSSRAPYSNKTTNSPKTWLNYTVILPDPAGSTAAFTLRGRNTKSCRLIFENPVSSISIEDSESATTPVGGKGASQIRLFSRTWDKEFKVNVTWEGQAAQGQAGQVMCLWNDVNRPGVVPAYDEVSRFGPVWGAVTKSDDGLVEGFKEFKIH